MRKTAALTIAFACLLTASVAFAGKSPLVGKWMVLTVTEDGKPQSLPKNMMVVELKRNGTIIITAREGGKVETTQGTWTVKGKKVTTVTEGKTEEYNWSIKRKVLTVKQIGKARSMTLKRM